MKHLATITAAALFVSNVAFAGQANAGQAKPAAAPAQPSAAQAAAGVTPPDDYVIGAGDVLVVNFWEEPNFSTDAALVRPDGKITLPLINDVDARGLRTDQLQVKLADLGTKLGGLKDPRVTVIVRAINSRKVYVSGGIAKPGAVDLIIPMTVAQLISLQGGLKEFVNGENITILREEGGKSRVIKFNYKEVMRGINLGQNIPLKPGDTVMVPE